MSKGTMNINDLKGLGLRVLEQVNEAVAIITPDIRLAWVNGEFCRLTGYEREEVIGQPVALLRSGMHEEADYRAIEKSVVEHGRWQGEVWRRKKDGNLFPAWLTISAVYDDDGQVECFVDLFVDIDQIRREREELETLVNHDPLTGLPNRRLFWDRLESAVRRSQRTDRAFGLLFIDLDNFKQVNDHNGHRVGDDVLVRIARALKSCLRESDTIARVGGDEFAIVLEDVDVVEGSEHVTRRIRKALDSVPLPTNPNDVSLSASLGLSLYPQDGADAVSLYEAADRSMYTDKRARR